MLTVFDEHSGRNARNTMSRTKCEELSMAGFANQVEKTNYLEHYIALEHLNHKAWHRQVSQGMVRQHLVKQARQEGRRCCRNKQHTEYYVLGVLLADFAHVPYIG